MNTEDDWPEWLAHLGDVFARHIFISFTCLPLDVFRRGVYKVFTDHFGREWVDEFRGADRDTRADMFGQLKEKKLWYAFDDLQCYLRQHCPGDPFPYCPKKASTQGYNPHYYRGRGAHSQGRHRRK